MDYKFRVDYNFFKKALESNILLYCVVLLFILKLTVVLVWFNFPQNIFFADITKTALINFVNQERESLGLNVLSENEKLDQAAALKAQNMIQNEYFSHTSPTGITPWHWFSEVGYDYNYAGENLAIGFFDSEEVYKAWLNSPSHKDNLLNPHYKEIGTAVLSGFGENNTIVVVQLFGSQRIQSVQTGGGNATPETPNNVEKQEPTTNITEQKTQEPSAPIVAEQAPVESTGPKIVLGESNFSNSFYFKFLNYILYDYEELLQKLVYGFSFIMIAALLSVIYLSQENFSKKLVFRSLIIVVLLSLGILINKEVITAIIPHQIVI